MERDSSLDIDLADAESGPITHLQIFRAMGAMGAKITFIHDTLKESIEDRKALAEAQLALGKIVAESQARIANLEEWKEKRKEALALKEERRRRRWAIAGAAGLVLLLPGMNWIQTFSEYLSSTKALVDYQKSVHGRYFPEGKGN